MIIILLKENTYFLNGNTYKGKIVVSNIKYL